MKYISLWVFSLLIFCSCHKEEICEEKKVELNISNQTNAWLQKSYFNDGNQITFENNLGYEKVFKYSKTYHYEYTSSSIYDCDSGHKQLILINYERISRVYESQDSLKISLGTFIEHEGCNNIENNDRFFESFSFSMSNEQAQYFNFDNLWGGLGILSIVTNKLNSNPAADLCGDNYGFYPTIVLAGTEFHDVYGRENLNKFQTNLFYSKTEGLIGFIDIDLTEWKIKK